MNTRRIVEVALTTSLIASPAFAQSDRQAPASSNGTITATGCLIKEMDYRKAHKLTGTAFGGLGLGDEFVLVEDGCNAASAGKAYRLTGKREEEMKPFVGKTIEVTGSWDHKRDAKIAAGETKATLPPEIKIATFHEASAAPVASAVTPSPAPPVAAAPAPAPAPQSVEARNETPERTLPRTASNLPLVGFIGLISLMAALGLRLFRLGAA